MECLVYVIYYVKVWGGEDELGKEEFVFRGV